MIPLFENVQDKLNTWAKNLQVESQHNHPREWTDVIENQEKEISSRQISEQELKINALETFRMQILDLPEKSK